MTNYEWFVQNVNTMTIETLSNMLGCPCSKICDDNDSICDGTCQKAWIKWFNKEHKEPMPELRVGMFVKVRHYHSTEDYIGVITLDENDNKVIVYKETTWDFVASVKNNIIAIYNSSCFIDCDDENCIWRA